MNNQIIVDEKTKTEIKVKINTKDKKIENLSHHTHKFKFDTYVKNLKKCEDEPFLSYDLNNEKSEKLKKNKFILRLLKWRTFSFNKAAIQSCLLIYISHKYKLVTKQLDSR